MDHTNASTTRRTTSTVAALSAGLCVIGLLAGCGSAENPKPQPAPTTASPSPSPTPTDAADRAAVLDAYANFWTEQVKAHVQGTGEGTDLEKYATDKALGDVRISVVKFRDLGVTFTGAPTHTPEVVAIDTASTPKTATIHDCLDVTNWTPVDKATGKPKKVTNRLRYVLEYTARTVGPDWKMIDVTRHQDQPC
ncbi:hypothetical protein AB0K43_31200 [Kitasatospora sp. NPDC049258]|uniref:hypothetical protein n=1 Tax=Kitasatospora sp. NPDC049258 TaxID=3155394 RepID=UPI00344612B7